MSASFDKEPELSEEGPVIPERPKLSLENFRAAALEAAEMIEAAVAICRRRPGENQVTAHEYQNMPLDKAIQDKREIIEVVEPPESG